MNRELSYYLKSKLLSLPFIDLVAGMAQTLTVDEPAETGTKTYKLPVSYDTHIDGTDCTGQEKELIPDSSRKSIIYFEDFGVVGNNDRRGRLQGYTSTLRLVCWLNRNNLVGTPYELVTARMVKMINDALITRKSPENWQMFTGIIVRIARIPSQDANIFSRYTYRETDRQYLMPPFEFFAIDYTLKFFSAANCFGDLNWNLKTC